MFFIISFTTNPASCGNSQTDKTNSSEGSREAAEPQGPLYTVDVDALDPTVYPENYPLIPSDEFKIAFENMKKASMMECLVLTKIS